MNKTNSNDINELHDYGIDIANRTIFLPSNVDDNTLDFRSTVSFVKNLHFLEKKSKEPITIYLCTFGGCMYNARGIYDKIKKSPCHISIITYGHCMSAGTIILQAADKRISTENCSFMLHYGNDSVNEYTHKQNVQWTKHSEEIKKYMLDVYANKMKESNYFKTYSINKIKTFLRNKFNIKEDWILLPDEAMYYGLIDEII